MTKSLGEPLNILLSAYSCTPNAGSEPGVGFETLRAIADAHNVWVMTRRKNVEPLEDYFGLHRPQGSVHVIGIDLSPRGARFKKRLGPLGMYWYYDRWQESARRQMAELSELSPFDLVHHITFSADWAKAGVANNDVPFVWGPIGGGVNLPIGLMGSLGLAGSIEELFRSGGRALMRRRRWYRHAWRSARVVLFQNTETASLAPRDTAGTILPHSTALLTPPPQNQGERTKEVLVIGRLIPWKGGSLALRAFHQLRDRDASLHFLGSGPDQRRLQAIAVRLGLDDRVRFEGALPRKVVLDRIARSGALLHPAVHDESPITIGEALSLGTPVACLDHGGPPELLRRWPDSPGKAVQVTNVKETSRRLAQALDRLLDQSHPILTQCLRPLPTFAESILDAYALVMDEARKSSRDPS